MTYHFGSRAVQERVGVRELADHVGRSVGQDIRPVAAAFLELQPMLVLGAADPVGGAVWASLLTGEPGFVRATGVRQISVTGGGLRENDPLARALATPGTSVGTIALDPRTRRRMRLNGRARPTPAASPSRPTRSSPTARNTCRRGSRTRRPSVRPAPPPVRRTLPGQRRFVESADTFFLATVHAHGADASHRGGNPGFVHVTSPHELHWRDYPGNSMFLTLGNLETDPRAGLLFLDWAAGTVLQLTGTARTEYAADGERTVGFTVTEVVQTPAASPIRWSPPEYSPTNPSLP